MYNITEREPLSRTPSLRIKGSDSRPFIFNLRLDVGERSFNQVNDRYHRITDMIPFLEKTPIVTSFPQRS